MVFRKIIVVRIFIFAILSPRITSLNFRCSEHEMGWFGPTEIRISKINRSEFDDFLMYLRRLYLSVSFCTFPYLSGTRCKCICAVRNSLYLSVSFCTFVYLTAKENLRCLELAAPADSEEDPQCIRIPDLGGFQIFELRMRWLFCTNGTTVLVYIV